MNYPTEGNYPQNEKEVVLSADAKELFGVKVGDSITLNTHAGIWDIPLLDFIKMILNLTVW